MTDIKPDSTADVFELSPEELLDHAKGLTDTSRALISESGLALSAVFRQLALNRLGEVEEIDLREEDQLIDAARRLVSIMGLDDMVDVRTPELTGVDRARDIAAKAQKIRSKRKQLGLTQQQFGEQLGISRFTVNRAEKGIALAAIESILVSDIFSPED